MVVGGVLAIVGALMSWVALSAGSIRATRGGRRIALNGVDLADGKVILVAAVIAVAAAVVAWFVRHREVRIVLGVLGAMAGLVVVVLSIIDAVTPSRSIAAVAAPVADQFDITVRRAEAILRAFVARGEVSVTPQVGLYLAVLGGVVILAGGIAVAAAAGSRRAFVPGSGPGMRY
jgi:hypothetical protein